MAHQLSRWSVVALAVLQFLSGSFRAADIGISRAAIERAVELGRSAEAERQRFHARYVVRVGHPTVQSVEVITEFRRVVLAKEEQTRLGHHLFAARDAEQLLQSWRGRLSVVAHLRFSPQNNLVSLPPYEVLFPGGGGLQEIRPVDIRRVPVFSDTTLVVADIEAIFQASPLAQAKRPVVVQLPPSQVTAATIDFASIE